MAQDQNTQSNWLANRDRAADYRDRITAIKIRAEENGTANLTPEERTLLAQSQHDPRVHDWTDTGPITPRT